MTSAVSQRFTVAQHTAREQSVARERARILHALDDQVERLAERGAAAIHAEIPYYRKAQEGLLIDMRDQVLQNYRAKLRLLGEQRDPTLDDLSFIRQAAIRRARAGCALEDYVSAWRVGQQLFWDALVEVAGESPSGREAALSLARPVMRYVDFASTHAAHAYAEFQRFALLDAHQERDGLLDRLLAGELPTAGPLQVAAHAYGLTATAKLLVVSAVPVDSAASQDRLHSAGVALSRVALVETRTLVVVRRAEIIAVPLLDRTTSAEKICQQLDAAEHGLRAEGVELTIAVSTVADGVSEIPRALLEARSALQSCERVAGVVALPRLSAFEYLVLRADDTAGRLVGPHVRAFLREDRARGGILTSTLRALVHADLNVSLLAQRLHVHPNTAHYRLGRIRELTGHNPRKLTDLLELTVAIELEERNSAGAGSTAPIDTPTNGRR
jgi:DNA-binding PucR family transcriptional regulator